MTKKHRGARERKKRQNGGPKNRQNNNRGVSHLSVKKREEITTRKAKRDESPVPSVRDKGRHAPGRHYLFGGDRGGLY